MTLGVEDFRGLRLKGVVSGTGFQLHGLGSRGFRARTARENLVGRARG